MSTTVNPLVGHAANGNATSQTVSDADLALLNGIKNGTVRYQAVKPKKAVAFGSFGQAEDEAAKPKVGVEASVDTEGRIHIVIPTSVAYDLTRDTPSANRRSVYCVPQMEEGVEGWLYNPENPDEKLPVKLSFTTGFSMSASAIKVSA